MNLEALRKFCGGLPGATRDIKWGADEVYSVGAKMFAVFWIDKGKAKTVSFKAGSDRFLELTDLSGIVPAPYLARAHWVHVRDAKALSDADARALVSHSRHAQVRAARVAKNGSSIRRIRRDALGRCASRLRVARSHLRARRQRARPLAARSCVVRRGISSR